MHILCWLGETSPAMSTHVNAGEKKLGGPQITLERENKAEKDHRPARPVTGSVPNGSLSQRIENLAGESGT